MADQPGQCGSVGEGTEKDDPERGKGEGNPERPEDATNKMRKPTHLLNIHRTKQVEMTDTLIINS